MRQPSEVALPAESAVIAGFTRLVAATLGLGEAYLFPTRSFVDEPEKDPELEWCADGSTAEGVSIWLLTSPERAQLVFGNSLRPRTLGGVLRDGWAGDHRLEKLDLAEWERRLHAAVEGALGNKREAP